MTQGLPLGSVTLQIPRVTACRDRPKPQQLSSEVEGERQSACLGACRDYNEQDRAIRRIRVLPCYACCDGGARRTRLESVPTEVVADVYHSSPQFITAWPGETRRYWRSGRT